MTSNPFGPFGKYTRYGSKPTGGILEEVKNSPLPPVTWFISHPPFTQAKDSHELRRLIYDRAIREASETDHDYATWWRRTMDGALLQAPSADRDNLIMVLEQYRPVENTAEKKAQAAQKLQDQVTQSLLDQLEAEDAIWEATDAR